jgi:hypothetical protein
MCVPHKRASHRREPRRRAPHGRAPHGRAPHGRVPHRRASQGCVPHKRASRTGMRFVGVHDVDVHPSWVILIFRKFSFVPKLPYLPPYFWLKCSL